MKNYYSKILKILFKRFFIFSVCIFLNHASTLHAEEINVLNLISQGKGIQAQNIIQKDIENASGIKKISLINDLLDLCLITSDIACSSKIFYEYYKILYEDLNGTPRSNEKELLLWLAKADGLSAKHDYIATYSLMEKYAVTATDLEKDKFLGNPNYEYASLRATMKAKLEALLNNPQSAEQHLRKSRAILFQRSLRTLNDQISLVSLVETSYYMLNDTQDIKRWIQSTIEVSSKTPNFIYEVYSPYILVRLAKVAYDSGLLNRSQEIIVISLLNKLYKNIEVPELGLLSNQREVFYAELALLSTWEDTKYDFDPIKELYNIKTITPTGIGVKSYLELINKAPINTNSSTSLKEVILKLENSASNSSENIKMRLLPTIYILKSLDSRSKGAFAEETKYLKLHINAQIHSFSKLKKSVLDKLPLISKSEQRIDRYVLERMNELAPNSDEIRNFAFILINIINASQKGDENFAYSLLSASKNQLEKEQILNLITVNERYSHFLNDVYHKASFALSDSKNIGLITGETQISNHFGVLGFLDLAFNQLDKFNSIENPILTTKYTDIQAELQDQESAIFFAETSDFLLVMQISKTSTYVKLVNIKGEFDLLKSVDLLNNKRLIDIDESIIKKASLFFTSTFINPEIEKSKQISFFGGATLMGVPYTLLANPRSKKWLIESANLRAYSSFQHYKLTKNTLLSRKKGQLVGFANPRLRGSDEIAAVNRTESLIRGVPKGVTSLPELPETENEVLNLFGSLKGNKKIFFREKANVNTLFSVNLDETEIAAFSTHGVLAGEIDGAISSSLILSPTQENSGIVSSDQLFSLKGTPRVVVLSTCNSAIDSQNLNRSDVTSLSSAFLMKGSNAVIASYWQVNSLGTSELMRLLSLQIAKEAELGDALSSAIRSLIISKRTQWSHPSVWAAFTVTGKYQTINDFTSKLNEKILDGEGTSAQLLLQEEILVQTWTADPKKPLKIINVSSENPNDPIRLSTERAFEFPGLDVSKNTNFGVFFVVRDNNKAIFYKRNKKNDYLKICDIEISTDWWTKDFFVKDDYIFALFTKKISDKEFKYVVTSQSLDNCKLSINGPHNFNGYVNNLSDVFLFPGPEKNTVMLASHGPVINSNYESFNIKFNMKVNCPISWRGDYFILSSDLKVVFDNQYDNIKFINTSNPIDKGVKIIHIDGCSAKERALYAPLEIFKNREFIYTKLKTPSVEADLKIINKEFSSFIDWWSNADDDKIYVYASTGFVSSLFENRVSKLINENAMNALNSHEYGIFVYSKKMGTWDKLFSSEDCSSHFPLSYSNVFGLCMNFHADKIANKVSLKFYKQ